MLPWKLIIFLSLFSKRWRISQASTMENISSQHQAYRRSRPIAMWHKEICIYFIVQFGTVRQVALMVVNPLDQTFRPPTYLRLVRAFYPVLLSCLSAGMSFVHCNVFSYRCGLAPSSGKRFLYSQLAVRCTDCECSHFRLLQCNLNSSVLDKPPDSCPISISNLPYLKCGIKLFPPLGPHQVQCHYDRRIVLLSPDFSPLRLYNINTKIDFLSSSSISFSVLQSEPTKYGIKVFTFGVRSSVNNKILLLTVLFDFIILLKLKISTYCMASWLLGGSVTGLQRRVQLELVSSLGARWRQCTAPYYYFDAVLQCHPYSC